MAEKLPIKLELPAHRICSFPGSQRRDLKTHKLAEEIASFFQTPRGRGKDDAGVRIQRLKGTYFVLMLSPLQPKDPVGPLKKVTLGEMQRANTHANGRDRQQVTVFLHQPEMLTGISVFSQLLDRIGVQALLCLGGSSNTSFVLSTETGVSLKWL